MRLSRGIELLVIWVTCVSGSEPCPENCKEMKNSNFAMCNDKTGSCSLGCRAGYYGDTCNMMCNKNCQRMTCQREDGSCTCIKGYTFNRGTCDSNTGVKCLSNVHCMNDTCLSVSRDDCFEGCKPGRFGKFCQQHCSSNCLCDQDSGTCTSCFPGWYGEDCRYSCSIYCKGKNCDTKGTCVDGCSSGSFGERCDLKCSARCVSECDQLSGECVQCEAGWYGSTCESECSAGCAGANKDCMRDSTDCSSKKCNNNGTCLYGCTTGSFGERCEWKCSAHCVSGCDQLSGDCVQCEAARYGPTCEFKCSPGCAGSINDCNKDGTCIRGCGKGYYGEDCGSACSEGCYDGICDLKGNCSTCKPGLYGSFCLQSCEKCSDGLCDVIIGTCSKGCQIGLYGEMCKETCGKCTDQVCDGSTGECSKGCQSGYYGLVCDMACFDCKGACDRNTGECKGTWMPYIIGGGVLLSFGVLAVFIACCLKRMHNIVKEGVDLVAQKTAVHFVSSHGMTSIEDGNIEYKLCGSGSDDTYNHLFDIKPPVESTFFLATDDLETSSGYCAVRPLFRGLSSQLTDENDDGSCGGSGRESDTCNSCISVCEGNGSEHLKIKMEEATATVEGERLNISVFKEEQLIQASTEILVLTSNDKGTCGYVQKDKGDETAEKPETDGCPDFDVGKQRLEQGDPAVTDSILNTNEGYPSNDDI